MTAIVVGNTLGLTNTSQALPGISIGNANSGSNGERVYVNVETGNLVLQQQDDILRSVGANLTALRTYNSQGQFDGDNNDNWRIGFYRNLKNLTGTVNTAGSSIVRVNGDGAEATYAWDSGSQAYLGKDGAGSDDTLSYDSTLQQWTWTDGDSRMVETYDWDGGAGKLRNQADVNGNTCSYDYGNDNTGLLSRVTGASSSTGQTNYIDLVYDTTPGNTGNLLSLSDSVYDLVSQTNKTITRTSYTYESYAGGSRLKTVSVDLTPGNAQDANSFTTTYVYVDGSSKLLSSLLRSDGSRLDFTWNGNMLASVADALGNTTRYGYDSANRVTSVTDPLNITSQYGWDAAGRLSKVTVPLGGGATGTRTYQYNDHGDLTLVTDELGRRTVMQYDGHGNLTLRRDDLGNTQSWVYDGSNRLLEHRSYTAPDPDGADPAGTGTGQPGGALLTRYVYDQAGKSRLRFVISPEGRVTEYRYNDAGQRIAMFTHASAVYTGSTASESDLANWVASGSVDKTRSARTDYNWDFRGQLQSSVAWGSVSSSGEGVAGTGAKTSFTYDSAGLLLATTEAADGAGGIVESTSYAYDGLGRVLAVTNGLGETTSYAYDASGNTVSTTAANGLVTINSFDAAGRLLSVERRSGQLSFGIKRYYYDQDSGNYVALSKSSLPSDIDNDVKTIIVSRIDGAEAQVELASSTVSVINYSYDELGRRLSATDGSGTTRYTYDLAGNVTRVDKPSNASGAGVFTITTYDAQGHKASETSNGAVRTLTWTNDYFGRVTSHTMLSGTVLGYTYNYAGQVTQEAGDANGRAVTRSYNAYGELTGIIDRIDSSGNRTTFYSYDLAGNRTSESTMGASGVIYQNETIGYDEMGRMTSVLDSGNGVSLSYLYDLEGNRALQTTTVNGVTTKLYYAYDSMNRQVLVGGAANFDVNNSANITSTTGRKLTYDFNGNRTSETAANVTDNYVYDALNRLVKVTRNGNTLRYIKYDAADRVLESFDRSEEGSTDAVHYTNIYDAAGRLVRQYHRSGSSINSSDVITTGTDQSCTYNTYDDAGDLLRSVDQLFGEHTFITTSVTTYTTRSDSKVQSKIEATRSDNTGNSGKSFFSYDFNGYLGSVTDEDKSANTRSFVTNVDGQILQKSQTVTSGGTSTINVLRNLVANNEVLGTYGVGAEGDAAPVVSKVKVKVVMHVVTQNDSGGGNTSEFDVTFNAGGVSYHTYQEDISDGEEISTMLSGIAWPPANNKLTITLTGKEVDPLAPDDPLVTGTLNITTSQWTTEGQAFQSGNFANGDATYYLKAYLYSDQADPNPSDVVRNFNVAYQVIDAAHPGSGPGSYTVRAGDTLRSIAQGAYGDSALWYLVADANGLSAGASLQAGTVLKLPSTVGTIHNNADTYRPYDPARIVGDTSPYMVPPSTNSNTCKTVSIIIAAVLAAVVITVLATMATVATLGALGVPAMSAAGVAISLIFAAAGGAVSSMASQGILIAGGVQHEMDWAEVATSAAIGAATAGVAMAAGSAVRVAVEQGSRSLKAARSALEEAAIYRQLAVEVNELEQGSARAFKLYDRAESALKAASKPSIRQPALAFSAGEALQKEAGTFGKVPWMLKQSFGNFLISLAGDMAIAAVSEIVSQVIRRLMPDGGDNRSLRERFSDFDWNAVLLATLTPGSGASGAKIGAVKDAEKLALSKLAHEKAVKKEMAFLEDASRELDGVRKGIVSVPDITPSWTDRAVAAAKAAGASMKALTKTKVGAPLTAVATGALLGFAGGLAKSSIVQGLLMAVGQQDEFDTKGMLLFGAANAVGGGINKGLLKLGSQRVNDATEKTDTVTFDAWRVSSALLGSLAANFELNASSGVASNESIAGYADVQDKSITGAYMVGYFRVGGMAGSRS